MVWLKKFAEWLGNPITLVAVVLLTVVNFWLSDWKLEIGSFADMLALFFFFVVQNAANRDMAQITAQLDALVGADNKVSNKVADLTDKSEKEIKDKLDGI